MTTLTQSFNARCPSGREIFDGPPGQEAYLLNPGDPGLLRQLDTIDASAASKRPLTGKTTIAAHVDQFISGARGESVGRR
ncbi:MAG TPA: hypothetical protein VGL29_01150 [Blastocatellia bacterium]